MIFPCDIFGTDYVEEMRSHRNRLLAKCDWSVLPDSPLSESKQAEWATYRQALRDFPATWTPAATADFPDPPA